MSALAQLRHLIRSALLGLWRAKFVHGISILALAVALFAFVGSRIADAKVKQLQKELSQDVEMTVYFKDGTSVEQMDELQTSLLSHTQGKARRVSPDEALADLANHLGDEGKVLRDLPKNPLPWSVSITWPNQMRDVIQLEKVAQTTRQVSFVAGVDYSEEALRRLQDLTQRLRTAAYLVLALAFSVVVIVVAATLQLAIYSRRDEIEIQKLVGATDWFIRLPFLIEGSLQGILATGIVLLVGATFGLIWNPQHPLHLFGLDSSAQVSRLGLETLALGIGLGLLGSLAAVRRFLKV